MQRSGLLIGGAAAAAVAILALAWLFGGDAPVDTTGPRDAPRVRPPADVFGPVGDPDASPVQRIDRAEFVSEREDRVTVLSFDALEPRTDYVSDFTEPRAELYFGNGRLLVIEGPAATIYHPGNDPQRGSFDRDVVVSLFEAPDEATLDPDDDTQVVFRVHLDAETNFDRDIGRIVSDGPVFVTGPDAEFVGHGLELTYNTRGERIESMTIERGEYLRLKRPGQRDADDELVQAQAGGESVTPSPPKSDASLQAFPSPKQEQSDNPPQFYRAEFAENVDVRVGQGEAELRGDALDVVFAFEDSGASPENEDGNTPPESRPIPDATDTALQGSLLYAEPTDRLASTDVVASDSAPPLVAPSSRSLLSPHSDDVVVTWTGPLRLLPLDTAPDHLHTGDDAMLALRGAPAKLTNFNLKPKPDEQRDEAPDQPPAPQTVSADELRYFTATDRVEALGSVGRPFVVDDPTQGRLTGMRLALDPPTATGHVQGPGQLLAFHDADRAADRTPALDLDFATHLDLAFDTDAAGDLTTLQQAVFQGDVHARAYDPAEKTSNTAEAPSDTLALDVTAQTVIVDLAPDADGRAQPTALTARRGVLAREPGRSIRADSLRAELAPTNEPVPPKPNAEERSDEASDHTDTDLAEGDVTLTALRAHGNITVHSTDERATLTGERLVALPEQGQLTLAGRDDAPARVQTPDADLRAPQLEFFDDTQTLLATGAGTLTSTRTDSDHPDANAEPSTLHLKWDTHLHYHGHAGRATALGQLVATTTGPTESTRLEAHRLDLTFVPLDGSPDDSARDTNAAATPDLTLDLRTARATPDPADPTAAVTLAAETPDPRDPVEPATRLTLIGPDLFLENDPADPDAQRLAVTGPGQMLFEDYRADEDADAPGGDDAAPLQLAGQGITYFRWTDALTVNLVTNDSVLLGKVQMNHDPPDGQPNIQLYGDRLTADLTEAQPLAAMLNPDDASGASGQDPELRRVQLDGGVRVTQDGRVILADQLIFEAADRDVLLQAAPGRAVRVYDPDRGNLDAEALLWNLDRDRIRVTNYRGGVLPVE